MSRCGDSLIDVRHWSDFGVIFALLISTAVIGFWEEHQAGNAIAALKQKLASGSRETQWQMDVRRRT